MSYVSTPSRLFHGKLSGSEADVTLIGSVSAVPTGERWLLRCLTVVNNGTADRVVLLRLVPSGETSGAEHNLLPGQTASIVKAGETIVLDGQWTLHAGDKVRGSCGSANEVTVRGDGLIVTGF